MLVALVVSAVAVGVGLGSGEGVVRWRDVEAGGAGGAGALGVPGGNEGRSKREATQKSLNMHRLKKFLRYHSDPRADTDRFYSGVKLMRVELERFWRCFQMQTQANSASQFIHANIEQGTGEN